MVTDAAVTTLFGKLTDLGWKPGAKRRASARDDVRDALLAAVPLLAPPELESELAPPRRAVPNPQGAEARRAARWAYVPKEHLPENVA